MKLLLDTHTFLWWDNEPSKLSATAVGCAFVDPANAVYLTARSGCLIVIGKTL